MISRGLVMEKHNDSAYKSRNHSTGRQVQIPDNKELLKYYEKCSFAIAKYEESGKRKCDYHIFDYLS